MTSILNAPRTIQGDRNAEPGEYGRSAYRNLHDAEQSTMQQINEQGDFQSALRLMATSVRYTPDSTVKNGHLNEEGQKNLLGFADEFITAHDRDGNHALDKKDFYEQLIPKEQSRLDRIDYELEHPKLGSEEREHLLEEKKKRFEFLNETSADLVEFLDLPNAKGETDGLVSKDEAAAHFLTQDGTLENIKRNLGSIKEEFKKNSPDASWEFFQLKVGVGIVAAQIISRVMGREAPFKLDGRISGAERFVSGLWAAMLPESARGAIIKNYQEHDLEQHKPRTSKK